MFSLKSRKSKFSLATQTKNWGNKLHLAREQFYRNSKCRGSKKMIYCEEESLKFIRDSWSHSLSSARRTGWKLPPKTFLSNPSIKTERIKKFFSTLREKLWVICYFQHKRKLKTILMNIMAMFCFVIVNFLQHHLRKFHAIAILVPFFSTSFWALYFFVK